MGNKIYGAVVLVLWGSSMTWLMVAKILPPFFRGDAPRSAPTTRLEPVAWRIEHGASLSGYSVSQAVPGAMGTTEVHSQVRLDELPLPKLATQWIWMQGLLTDLSDLQLELRTKATYDTLGQLSAFETRVRAADTPPVARVIGRISGGVLKLTMRAGEFTHNSEHPWKGRSLLGGELSPESRLRPVYVGLKWREEVLSPFSGPGAKAELIEAEVVEEERLRHDGQLIRVKRIVFRSVCSPGVCAEDRVRAIVWVRDDGEVIRQDMFFMNMRLRFTRLSKSESQLLADSLLDLPRYATLAAPPLAE